MVNGFLEGGIASWKGRVDKVKSINAERMKDFTVEVLDVRKPGEWNISHLKDAKFVPLSDMPANLDSLDKHKTYIVHCGGGYGR